MADLSHNSSIAVVVEATPGTFSAPNTSTDLLQCADLKVALNGITVDINEYTGSIHKPGPVVLGATIDVTMKIYLRGPGGASPPAAGAWVPGRILRAAAFAEAILSTPPASEALGAGGTTTTAVLGVSAPAASADIYKGFLVSLSQLGATMPKNLTMIRAYSNAKAALLAEVGAAAFTGTYQMAKQLVYKLSPSSAVPTLSISVWQGTRRYDCSGMAVSSFKINLPTASRTNTALPLIDVTLSGTIVGDADDTAPIITPGLAIPPFRDGKLWVAGVSMGGSSLDVNFNATVAYPPDPNRPDGNAPAQMSSTKRTASLTLNQVLKATQDFRAIALAQANQPIMAMYGSATGNFFGVIVTDARFNFRSPDASGEFVTSTGDAFIDGANGDIALAIGFYP